MLCPEEIEVDLRYICKEIFIVQLNSCTLHSTLDFDWLILIPNLVNLAKVKAWEDVVSALRKMDENCVADHIKEMYCGEAVGAHTVAEGNTIIYYYARNNSYSCMLIDISNLNSLLKMLQIYLGEQQRNLPNGNDSAYEIF